MARVVAVDIMLCQADGEFRERIHQRAVLQRERGIQAHAVYGSDEALSHLQRAGVRWL